MFFNFMEVVMKKSLVLVAMLALATTLFAETEMVSCESDLGKCTYTLSDDSFSKNCVCRDETEFNDYEDGTIESTLPTDDECDAELKKVCKDAGIKCENEKGKCTVKPNGEYECVCTNFQFHPAGNGIFSEEGCNEILAEVCENETMTARKVCKEEEIRNACVSYFEKIKNTCFEPINDIDDILDAPLDYSDLTAHEIANCCQNEEYRNEYKTEFDCLEASGTCNACVDMPFDEGEEGKGDAANTEAPTTGATPEDTADGDSAPATDSVAPAEKEESKSDGCSMLFI